MPLRVNAERVKALSVDTRSGAVILLRRGVEAEKQLESLVDASEFA
jgi:hypothetical protein